MRMVHIHHQMRKECKSHSAVTDRGDWYIVDLILNISIASFLLLKIRRSNLVITDTFLYPDVAT